MKLFILDVPCFLPRHARTNSPTPTTDTPRNNILEADSRYFRKWIPYEKEESESMVESGKASEIRNAMMKGEIRKTLAKKTLPIVFYEFI